jgi:hypothetical protein
MRRYSDGNNELQTAITKSFELSEHTAALRTTYVSTHTGNNDFYTNLNSSKYHHVNRQTQMFYCVHLHSPFSWHYNFWSPQECGGRKLLHRKLKLKQTDDFKRWLLKLMKWISVSDWVYNCVITVHFRPVLYDYFWTLVVRIVNPKKILYSMNVFVQL